MLRGAELSGAIEEEEQVIINFPIANPFFHRY